MLKKKCRLLLASFCSIFITTCVIGQQKGEWQMQQIGIKTRWASLVDTKHPLPEYPRPQMVRDNNWVNLNGLWDYAITSKDSLKPIEYQGKILVPYPLESALSGVKRSLHANEILWYHKSITADLKQNRKIFLHFGAVDWRATVFLNGKQVGAHSGGYTSFSIDITNALNNGQNELVVKVFDPTDEGVGPHGKQTLNPSTIYYTSSSGIWQTVWLETVPNDHIEGLVLTPDIDRGILDAKVEASDRYEVELVAFASGKQVSSIKGETGENLKLPIKNAQLWSPDSPFLYDLQVRLLSKGKVIDKVRSYFGMRKISISKDEMGVDRIFLNNKYYFNLGTLDQGFWPDGLYTAPTDAALQFDIRCIKAMGFNTIRKHIKVEPARWYYYADKLGMLVWQDMVNPNQRLPVGSKEQFQAEATEIVTQLHNYPSIIMWVLFNEKWGQFDQERLTKWLKGIDHSRLINGHSGEYLYVNRQLRSPSPNAYVGADVTDVHSYPAPMISIKQPNKAQVCGEFGGIGVPIEGHLWNDLASGWGYNGVVTPALLQSQLTIMMDSLKALEQQGLSGAIYTQPFDVESEQNGLLTYDRANIKLPISTIQQILAVVWPITRNSLTATRNFRVEVSSPVKDYAVRLEEYFQGKKDSLFLRQLAIMAENKKDFETSLKAADDYIKRIVAPFAEPNILFIRHFVKNSNSFGFKLINEHRREVNEVLGVNQAEALIMNIIYKEEIAPYDKSENPKWEDIQQKVNEKYGALGEEKVWGHRVVYYAAKKEWSNFGKYFKLYFDRALDSKRNFININNLSWKIYEHVNDTSILSTALRAMEYQLNSMYPVDPFYMDTYANLLYKVGKKKEAIIWAKKAVSEEPNNKEINENYNRMKNGL